MSSPTGGPQPLTARPLADLRVLELAHWLAGPFAATLLADFGADVIKVERPDGGDGVRRLGTLDPADPENSYWWRTVGRNKRCITLDFGQPPGRELLGRLVATADVVIESFRPGTLETLGIGWDWLQALNPGLILLRVSGFGQTGPLRYDSGFDRVAQAFIGMTHVTGYPDHPPTRGGLPVVDYGSGVWGAFSILLALQHQARSGRREGQIIDLALYESLLPFLGEIPAAFDRFGIIPERTGNRADVSAPGDAFRAKDGWVHISCTGEPAFVRLATAIGRPELIDDPRYRTNADRIENREPLDALLAAWVGQSTVAEVMEVAAREKLAISRINSIKEVVDHPQTRARDNFVRVPVAPGGDILMTGIVPKLSLTPGAIQHAGPELGEHNHAVYVGELGYSEDDLARWREQGVI